jgi:hypothetical protein
MKTRPIDGVLFACTSSIEESFCKARRRCGNCLSFCAFGEGICQVFCVNAFSDLLGNLFDGDSLDPNRYLESFFISSSQIPDFLMALAGAQPCEAVGRAVRA